MPNFYNPYQYPQAQAQNMYQPQMQMPMQVSQQSQLQNMQQPQQQIQNGGFISVPSESVARNYPVAPGNSITFKDETAPYVYTKTMGFSQLDRPIFEKYRLVKEMPSETSDVPQNSLLESEPNNSTIEELKAEIQGLQNEIDDIKKQIESNSGSRRISKKKEVVDDDTE